MLFFTDPARTLDPVASASRLPRGAGVVYRPHGAADAVETGRALARVCRRRGLVLFVGADARLATRLAADGVHLPERLASACGRVAALRARFLVTAAAHSLPAALRARAAGVQAIVVSPVFPSRSRSAGRPLGALVFAAMIRRIDTPILALGGVNDRTARCLKLSGAAGFAAVEALA